MGDVEEMWNTPEISTNENIEIEYLDIQLQFYELKNGRSAEEHKISNELLRYGGKREHKISNEWRESTTILILKKGERS